MLSEGAFSLHRASGPYWTQFGSDLATDYGPLFTPNGSSGHATLIYIGANQWGRTCVSGNGNHLLLTISNESQSAPQFFRYRLPLLEGGGEKYKGFVRIGAVLSPCKGQKIWASLFRNNEATHEATIE